MANVTPSPLSSLEHWFVTGWNAENESVEWDGYGDTEDTAIEDAVRKAGIVEIGDACRVA